MKEYEFTALLEFGLLIEAENEAEARRIIDKYSAEGWKRNGDLIGLSDVELLTVDGGVE